MSRIHDALRRGRAPAPPPPARPAHTDAVLNALAYRRTSSAAPRRVLLACAILAIAGAGGWVLWKPNAANRAPLPPPAKSKTAAVQSGSAPAAKPSPAAATAIARENGAATGAGAKPAVDAPAAPVERAQLQNPRPAAPISRPPAPTVVSARRAPADPRPAPFDAQSAAFDPFQLALYHQRAGDFEQALLNYKIALKRDELNVEAHNNLGSLYLGRNLLDEAAREFQRVLAINPRYGAARINLSAALYKLGRYDAAAAEAREALRLDPRSADALVNLALAQKAAGQPAEAQDSLRRALELHPRHPIAHYNLARQFDAGGEAVRAVEHYRQFLLYAGPEQESYAADVRTRLQLLQSRSLK